MQKKPERKTAESLVQGAGYVKEGRTLRQEDPTSTGEEN